MGRHVSVAVALIGTLGGCAMPMPAPVQTYQGIEPSSSILALDPAAWKLVAVANQKIDREDDGRLRVKLELANLSSLPVPIQVQTVFRDKGGMLTGDETAWEMITIAGNGSHAYDVVSLKPDPGAFTVQIKTP